jgi:hypothetical protein
MANDLHPLVVKAVARVCARGGASCQQSPSPSKEAPS